MKNPFAALRLMLAVPLLSSVVLVSAPTSAQTSPPPPPATATRPGSPEQTSIPNNAPPASINQTTGQTNPDPMVRKMNEDEKRKIEKEGK